MDYKTFQVVSKCKVQNISENHTCSFQIKIFNSSLCVGFLHKNQIETHTFTVRLILRRAPVIGNYMCMAIMN